MTDPIRGVVGVHDIDANLDGAGQIIRDVDAKVYLKDPEKKPFMAITEKFKLTESTTQKKREYQTDQELGSSITITNNPLAAGGTTVTCSTADSRTVKAGDVLMYVGATIDQMICTAVADGSLTVSRGYGTTLAGAGWTALELPQGSILYNLGPDAGEKASAPEGVMTQPTMNWNWVQQYLDAVTLSKDATTVKEYQGDLRVNEHAKTIIKMTKRMEYDAMFGIRHKSDHTSGYASWDSGEAYKFGGLRYFIETNIKNLAGATLNEAYFEGIAKDIFRYGASRKALICSPEVAMRIRDFGMSQVQYKPDETRYGWKVNTYDLGLGTLDIHPHWLLSGMTTVTNTPMAGDLMFWVDFDEVKRVNKQTLTLYKDIQSKSDLNKVWDAYQAKFTWTFGREYTHGVIFGGK